ncbi:MAG: hypothetical protein CL875_04470 [Dehalococcoidales bacterium]|jgi:hypothetical protein|nr:hypothetical protein [Dehalococcoidales bacterium]|tara:strand:- start:475 stop:654 length:180 start_codon:yes stop_codon:yes gene_type:complete
MSAEVKRKRGAPEGNQNARKHGFYSKVLDEAEQLDFELATGVEGIDDGHPIPPYPLVEV